MKRVLILVLSTEKDWYARLAETSRATWDAEEVEGVETIFYFGASDRPSTDKLLFTNVADDFFNMGRKTLAAFEYALANREFDYVFRANASLYVDKAGLAKYCLNKPEQDLALGVVADCGNFEGEIFPFLWGPSFLLSRDVVQKVVDNAAQWNHRAMEDNAISLVLRALGIPLDNRGSMASIALRNGGYECIYYEEGKGGAVFLNELEGIQRRLPNQFAFRVKDDSNRENDCELMRELCDAFQHG